MSSLLGPIVPSHGPVPAPILILAEAPGTEESNAGRPLVGPSGWELRKMLDTVGLNLNDIRKVNVFERQPSANNLHLYCHDDPSRTYRDLGPLVKDPVGWMDLAHLPELERLAADIADCDPNVIIALGNTASWALGLGTGIAALRGSVHVANAVGPYPLHRQVKVVPSYHPAAVLRQWSLRTIAIADLEKARLESHSPLLSFDNTELWLNPTLPDLLEFDHHHMAHATSCACDIETKRGQTTAISFSPSVDVSLSIPFWLEGTDANYWPDAESEREAWNFVRHWLERPDLTKVFQNGLYDLQYLSAPPLSIRPVNCTEDTMLMAHSLYSELPKSLGFLGSVFANVPSWKSMRTFKRDEQFKRDE